jgi:hypothetical protein
MVIAVIVVVLVIAGAAVFVITHNDTNPPAAAPPTAPLTYRSQDGRVTVPVPAAPTVTELPPPINGRAVVAAGPRFEVVFLEVHPGPIAAEQTRSTLRAHVSLAAGLAGATVSSMTDTTFRGVPAVRGRGTYKGDPMLFLAFSTNGAEYAVIVHTKNDVNSVMRAVEAAIQIRH